jgi:hypothetical protein
MALIPIILFFAVLIVKTLRQNQGSGVEDQKAVALES